jgi:hypothetical protein
LKKNTEQLGSIFDAQPSEISGNIHNVANAAEPVIGYMSACIVQSKRIFITSDQLPDVWRTLYPYACGTDSNYYFNPKTHEPEVQINLIPLPPTQLITQAFFLPGPVNMPSGYLGSTSECVDCTIRGTTIKPGFWK